MNEAQEKRFTEQYNIYAEKLYEAMKRDLPPPTSSEYMEKLLFDTYQIAFNAGRMEGMCIARKIMEGE